MKIKRLNAREWRKIAFPNMVIMRSEWFQRVYDEAEHYQLTMGRKKIIVWLLSEETETVKKNMP